LKPILCADVDSTLWDTGAWVRSAVLDITGETLDIERITTWTHVLDTYGEKTTTAIFDRVFDPERVRDREPYPGAPEVLRALQERQGIEIHFVTHNDPEIMTPHLEHWLRGSLANRDSCVLEGPRSRMRAFVLPDARRPSCPNHATRPTSPTKSGPS
jgi:phosphoglycolate phosphatase-like HAD superfamily hydrolase